MPHTPKHSPVEPDRRPAHALALADRWLPLAGMVILLACGLIASLPAFIGLLTDLKVPSAALIAVMVDIGIVVLAAAWMSDTHAGGVGDPAAKWGALLLLAVSVAANVLHTLTAAQTRIDLTAVRFTPTTIAAALFAALPPLIVVAMSVFAERRTRRLLTAAPTVEPVPPPARRPRSAAADRAKLTAVPVRTEPVGDPQMIPVRQAATEPDPAPSAAGSVADRDYLRIAEHVQRNGNRGHTRQQIADTLRISKAKVNRAIEANRTDWDRITRTEPAEAAR